jgi:hypothetical protein
MRIPVLDVAPAYLNNSITIYAVGMPVRLLPEYAPTYKDEQY